MIIEDKTFFKDVPLPFIPGEEFKPMVAYTLAALKAAPYSARLVCALFVAGVGKPKSITVAKEAVQILSGDEPKLLPGSEALLIK